MEISETIEKCIAIIAREIELIEKDQENDPLDKLQCEKLIDYTKTLIIVEKDRRAEGNKDIGEYKTEKELEDAILSEAKKIKEKREQKTQQSSKK